MRVTLVALFALGWCNVAQGLRGKTSCPFGSPGCNVCAPRIEFQFGDLKHHGEVLGFHLNGFPDDIAHGLGESHWQGIARLSTGTGQYLGLTTGPDDNGGKVRFVEMGSRNTQGKRFRSNRLQKDKDTEDTVPPTSDKIISDDTPNANMKHGGGAQGVGKYFAAAFDQPKTGDGSEIVFYDMSNPKSPRISRKIIRGCKAAGGVAVTQLDSGKYLVAVTGFDKSTKLDLYYLDSLDGDDYSSLPDQTLHLKDGDLIGSDGCWPTDQLTQTCGWSFQGISLVNQCDGKIFLIGMQNWHQAGDGKDVARLYELVEQSDGKIKLDHKKEKHFYCNWDKAGHPCNFAASGTAFVDAGGNLILYSSEHANDGPSNTVKMVEFKSRHGNKDWTCSETGSSWIELYDDDTFQDRSVVLDFLDQDKDNFDDLKKLDGFGDKTSSMFWCLRAGCTGTIYWDHGFGGHSITLHNGGGQRHDMPWVNWHGRNWNDKISSVRMQGSC